MQVVSGFNKGHYVVIVGAHALYFQIRESKEIAYLPEKKLRVLEEPQRENKLLGSNCRIEVERWMTKIIAQERKSDGQTRLDRKI